jgi:NitT/TauT family transport system substrate-binding protein
VELQLLPALALLNDFDPSTVRIRELDYSLSLSALLSQRVDVVTSFYASSAFGWEQRARELGKELNFIRWSQFGLEMYGDVFITSDQTLRERPELVRRFLRATVRGFVYGVQQPREAEQLLQTLAPGENAVTIRENWRRTVETMMGGGFDVHGYGWIDSSRLEKTRSLALRALHKAPHVPLDELYTNEFLPGLSVDLTSALAR